MRVENDADNGAPCPVRNIRVGRNNAHRHDLHLREILAFPTVPEATSDNQQKRNRDKREDVEMFTEPGSFVYGLTTLSDLASIVVATKQGT